LPEELCEECNFIKWGFWDASVTYGEGQTAGSDTFTHGLWVAGALATVGEIDSLAALGGTATYAGTAIGSVSRLDGSAWITYQASGNLAMNWDFGQRSGDLTISEFDKDTGGRVFLPEGLTVSGTMNTPGQLDTASLKKNQFGGILTGSGLVGAATGSFVKNGDNVAAGVIGNWGAGGIVNQKPYEVIGIFGGKQTTPPNLNISAGPGGPAN
jgi:trimeric autotransporter adhesin